MNFKINKQYENEFKEFFINIKEYFKNNNTQIHKARNELKIIKYKDKNYVVKSFKVPHLINKIAYSFFRDSKAKKSYEHALKISKFTPTPIGYIEFFNNNLLENSYFVSEEFNYDFTIREPLLDNTFEDKENILKSFARFTYELHQHSIFHEDYSPGNILIKKEKNDYIFKIVDINRMRFGYLTFEDRVKNFSKLWASDKELSIIGLEYARVSRYNTYFTIKEMQYYSNKNKKIKNFKKILKGQKVVD